MAADDLVMPDAVIMVTAVFQGSIDSQTGMMSEYASSWPGQYSKVSGHLLSFSTNYCATRQLSQFP